MPAVDQHRVSPDDRDVALGDEPDEDGTSVRHEPGAFSRDEPGLDQRLPRLSPKLRFGERDLEHRPADEILGRPTDGRCSRRGDVDDAQVLVDHVDRRAAHGRQARSDLDPVVRLQMELVGPVREIGLKQRPLGSAPGGPADRRPIRPDTDLDRFAFLPDHPPTEV